MKKTRNALVVTSVLIAVAMIFCIGGCKPKGSTSAPANFSADLVTKNNAGTFEGKIYFSDNMTRMDMPQSSVITRLDKDVVWIVMPEEKMYIEQPIKPENVAMKAGELPGETQRELVLTEEVNGRKTDKFKITYAAGGKTQTIFQWIDKENGIPLRTSAEDGKWYYEYKNVKPGTQSLSLFQLPEGYNKFTMPKFSE